MNYQLSNRGFLKVEGPDAVKFMQGYTTCDLTSLSDDEPQIGATCNLQGRMLTSYLLVKRADDLYLRMHRPLVQKTIDFLSKYIVFSKADLVDISDDLACYGSFGESDIDVGTGFRLEFGIGTEFWLPGDDSVDTADDSSPWSDAEIEAGIAWVTEATSEEYLPQMFNYHELGGIDFDKGCYLGQEIVARAQYRGELKRRLHRLTSTTARTIGDTVNSGMIVGSAPSGLLAVLQNAANEPVTVTFEDGEEVEAIPLH